MSTTTPILPQLYFSSSKFINGRYKHHSNSNQIRTS